MKLCYSAWYNKDKRQFDKDILFEIDMFETELRHGKLKPGCREEKLIKCKSGEPLHSYRINKGIRVITYRWKTDELMMLLVDRHDPAYKRADRVSRVRLDWRNGKEQVPYLLEDPDVAPEIPCKTLNHPVHSPAPAPLPFKDYTEGQLAKLGVPKEKMEGVRAIKYTEDIDTLFDGAAEEEIAVGARLLDIMGGEKYDDVVRQKELEEKRPPFKQQLRDNPALREFYADFSEGEWEKFLNGTLEDWHVFLHRDQTRAVEIEAAGPVMVSGAAGTGKTVVAAHRVRWLLRQKGFEGKILFTTYTKTLAHYAKKMLGQLCSDEEMARVEVIHFDAFLSNAWTRGGTCETKLVYDDKKQNPYPVPKEIEAVLGEYFQGRRLLHGRDIDFIKREWLEVILEHDINTLEAYKKLQRQKVYGFLSAQMRERLWPVFEACNTVLERFSRVKRRPEDAAKVAALNALARALAEPGDNEDKTFLLGRYGAVVVDEAQDFGASEYRFFAALTGNTMEHPRPTLFLVGDGRQRIYGRVGAFSHCGINVVNRSIILSKCYRSTAAIREYAERLLEGVEVKGMNGEAVESGGESLVAGEPPEERYFSGNAYEQCNRAVFETIKSWQAKASSNLGDYAVLAREGRPLYKVAQMLKAYGLPVAVVDKHEAELKDGEVNLMTMHRAKGLQFVGVVILLDHWPRRPKELDVDDDEALVENDRTERQLLYMAITRAQRFVLLTSANDHRALRDTL